MQRVVVNLTRALSSQTQVELVTWDDVDGTMRFCDEKELQHVFGRNRPAALRSNPQARSVGLRFQDLVPSTGDVWMLFPEIAYHLRDGWVITQRVVTQCLEAGWRTAAVLYDLIPIYNSAYVTLRLEHERYVAQLLRLDAIIAISRHVEAVFHEFVADQLSLTPGDLATAGTYLGTVVLPGGKVASRPGKRPPKRSQGDRILLLGTIEPRKQQVRVLRCYRRLLEAGIATIPMQVIGSLHASVASEFRALISDDPRLQYSGYMSDEDVAAAFARARFSVFASDDEGFGLPITESLSHCVPCLTANFGAMAEIAADGGCLTVDVRDDAALTEGLRQLVTNDDLLTKLQKEARKRPQRDWNDYAAEFLAVLQSLSNRDWHDQIGVALQTGDVVPPRALGPGSPGLDFCCTTSTSDWLRIARGTGPLQICPAVEVLLLSSDQELDAALEASQSESAHALPGWIDSGAQPAETLASAVGMRSKQTIIAQRERNFATAVAAFDHPTPKHILSIVISTYNRASFLAANVEWIIEQMAGLHPAVDLVVVDNASTDDSVARVRPFLGIPGVRLVVNSANTGMLGNLRVCSSLLLAEHVWLIGDDDFIMPGMLHRILRILSVHPTIPLVLMNFGVYHRTAMTSGDSAPMFVSERQILAPHPAPEGLTSVIAGGSEHDNLFTAIYPIIFRADLAAAVFNHPFTGRPFRSLVESIPTTRFILENYALADAYWISDPCIVGNAHNSWQRYRVAWHAVLMPLALRLARRCGMDAVMLHRWAQTHLALFEEARRLFPTPRLAEDFDADALSASRQVFGRILLTAEADEDGL